MVDGTVSILLPMRKTFFFKYHRPWNERTNERTAPDQTNMNNDNNRNEILLWKTIENAWEDENETRRFVPE